MYVALTVMSRRDGLRDRHQKLIAFSRRVTRLTWQFGVTTPTEQRVQAIVAGSDCCSHTTIIARQCYYGLTVNLTLKCYKQGIALTGRNRTGPPCSVGRPTAHAPGGRTGGSVTDDDR